MIDPEQLDWSVVILAVAGHLRWLADTGTPDDLDRLGIVLEGYAVDAYALADDLRRRRAVPG